MSPGRGWTCLLMLLLTILYAINYVDRAQVVFLDVYQGDATLIVNSSEQILIDGGPGDYVVHSLSQYIPFWDRKIEYLILTHPHDDHLAGLMEVVNRYEIGTIILNPVCYKSSLYKSFLSMIQTYNVIYAMSVDIQFVKGSFEVAYTERDLKEATCDIGIYEGFDQNINNDSVIVKVNYFEKEILLMGDTEKEKEKFLLDEGMLENINVLKAGHHCSNTSSSLLFLEAIKPELVICSLGRENKYGHPGSETIQRFNDLKIKYLMTSDHGDIVLNN